MSCSPAYAALDDLAELIFDHLGGRAAARILATGAAQGAHDSIAYAETLRDAGDDARMGALQAWRFTWSVLAAEHPELFGAAPPDEGMTAVGLALAYALAQPAGGLRSLALKPGEADALSSGRAALCGWTDLVSLRRPCHALVITAACRALRAYPDLALPGVLAFALGHEPRVRRNILVTAQGADTWRAQAATPSHLVLGVLHEELHVALASAANPRNSAWSALSAAAEEAVVSSLDLAAERWLLHGTEPTRGELLAHCADGFYAQAVEGLLLRLWPGDDKPLLRRLAELGVDVVGAGGDDRRVVDALNSACETSLTAVQWLDTLPLD